MIENDYSIMRTAILTAFPKIFTDIEFSNEIFQQSLKLANLYNFSFQPELFTAKMSVEIEARYKAVSNALSHQIKETGGEQERILVIEIATGLSPRCLQFNNVDYIESDMKPVIELKKRIFKNLNFQDKIKNFYIADLTKPEQLKNFLLKIPQTSKYKKVIIVSEGLFWYMKQEDIAKMANVFTQTFGDKMIWISSDCPVKTPSSGEYRKIISTSANSKRNTFESIDDFVQFFQKLGFKTSYKCLSSLVSPQKIKSGKIFSLSTDEIQKRIDSYTNVALISPIKR